MGTKFGPAADVDWPVMRWYIGLILVAFIALVGRLFWLQVVEQQQHRLASLSNIIRDTPIPGPRGDIYDRAGYKLATSRNTFGLLYIPPRNIDSYLPSKEIRHQLDVKGQTWDYLHSDSGESLRELQPLAAYLGLPYTELMERVEIERRRHYGYQPLLLAEELTQEQLIYLREHQDDYPGILIERFSFKREYPLGELAAHLVGYVGVLSDSDPKAIKALGYDPGEKVGKEGAERTYEEQLHGNLGRRDILLRGAGEQSNSTAGGRVIEGVANEHPPLKGTSIYLTVHKESQAQAQRLLGVRPGAIIVSSLVDGHEGEILALASSPSFDANLFSDPGYYASLISNKDGSDNEARPLLNRAYRHAYPPGSTFKLVTATAALMEGVATPGTSYTCEGYIEVGRNKRKFHCHNRNGHGRLSFTEGISESCDVYFYRLGQALGQNAPELLKHYGNMFGYGAPVGIDLPGEVSGLLPEKDWKRKNYSWANEVDRLWYEGDTLNYVIGQGFVTATPLQVLWSVHLIALDGKWITPRLLFATRRGESIEPVENTTVATQRPLDTDALRVVRDGMRLAVVDGTCKQLNLEGMYVCAKSGTAETGIPGKDDHAWVTGYYPMDAPQIGFVVFFENGGSAGDTAVPTARELLKYLREHPPLGE